MTEVVVAVLLLPSVLDSMRHFFHFTVNHHNILPFIPLTFPGILHLSVPIGLCHRVQILRQPGGPGFARQYAELSDLLSCSQGLSASPSVDNRKSFSNLSLSSYFLTGVPASRWASVPNNTFQGQQRLKSLRLPGPTRWSACSHILPNTRPFQLSLPFPP